MINPYSFWTILEYFQYWEVPFGFYQIWTPLNGYHPYWPWYHFVKYVLPSGVRRLFRGYLVAEQYFIFSNDLPDTVIAYHKSAKNIPSLRFVSMANEQGEPILLATMTYKADKKDVASVINLLKKIATTME